MPKRQKPVKTLQDLLIYAAERRLLPSQLAQNVKAALKQIGMEHRQRG